MAAMDLFGRLAQTDRIDVEDDGILERQRRALAALANWASDCLAYDESEALAYGSRMVHALDGGATVDRLIAEIGTDIERAGKPSVAGLASLIFARAMQAGDRAVTDRLVGHDRRRDASQFKIA